ncbi:amidohydrolase [Xanthobacteraceae bacterium Astr-EGSB]|uniref:amidohydrolase n=1 Tax=Astrobacterium formosum TaxID=3069710 RepID=UPI0027B478CA|nr:amidohydrolase [Xanthobacteraceae bacterium Astr-EGSB]
MSRTRRELLQSAAFLCLAALPSAALAQTLPLQHPGALSGVKLGVPATIFVARKIITMDKDKPEARAVAVREGRIVAVGTLAEVEAALKGTSCTIDRSLARKVLMPGLVEEHLHPLLGAGTMAADAVIAIEDWVLSNRTWPAAKSAADYRQRLQVALAADKGDTTFITWGYHHLFHGRIDRKVLDGFSPKRPLIVWHRSCHEFFLNTAALTKYGITAASLAGHGLASEQANFDEGHFFEKGMELVVSHILADVFTPDRLKRGLAIMQKYLHARGVTTICEPGTQMVRSLHQLFEAVLDQPDVPFRTYFIPDGRALYDKHKAAGSLDHLVSEAQSYLTWGKGKVRWLPNQIKLFADGAVFSQLMQVQEPYLDGHKGQWIAEPDDYKAAVRVFWDAGYQISTHVNGDAGLEVVTSALEEQMARAPRQDHRFMAVHFAMSTEAQVSRLVAKGALISANPYYVTVLADRYGKVGLGPARADAMVRLASAVRAGASISLHSDMPMAPPDPLMLAWAAINRTTVSGRVAGPEQRISRARALSAITLEAAYAIRLEKEIGSITPGKTADFVVLEQDPMTVDARKLKDVKVWGTVFEGRIMPVAAPSGLSFAPRAAPPAAPPAGSANADDGWREAIATAGLFCGCCAARMPMRRA